MNYDTQNIIEATEVEQSEALELNQGFALNDALEILRSSDPFPVSSAAAANWLGFAEKRKLQDRLKALFCVGVDFVESMGKKPWANEVHPCNEILETPQNGRSNVIYWMSSACFESLLWGMLASSSPNPSVKRVQQTALHMLKVWKEAKNQVVSEKREQTVSNSPVASENTGIRPLDRLAKELKQISVQLVAEYPASIDFVRLMTDRANQMEQSVSVAKTIASQAIAWAQAMENEIESLKTQLETIKAVGLDFSAIERAEAKVTESEARIRRVEEACQSRRDVYEQEYGKAIANAKAYEMKLRNTIAGVNEANTVAWARVQKSVIEFEAALMERGREARLRESDISVLLQTLPDIAELRIDIAGLLDGEGQESDRAGDIDEFPKDLQIRQFPKTA